MENPLAAALAHLAQNFGGSLGTAIVVLSLGLRVALLPLTVRMARRSLRNQAIARALQPEIDQLKKRLEKKPEQLLKEMGQLYRRHNYTPFDLPVVLGSFLQLPVFGILYGAIRSSLSSPSSFLWIRNLGAPNFVLTLLILALTGLSAYGMPAASAQARTTLVIIQLIVTGLFVWKLSAGLALYWASSSLVGLSQTLWIRWRPQPGVQHA